MSHAVLKNISTISLVNMGLRSLQPRLGLKDNRVIPNGVELLPIWEHEDEPREPANRGSRFRKFFPVPTLEPHSVKECQDCGLLKRAPVVHRLPCKHDVCHRCLANRALWPEMGIPRDVLLSMLRRVGQRLYDPNSEEYAREMEDKEFVLNDLWERFGWACCHKVIPFGDFIKEGLDSWIITSLIRERDHALRTIEGEGNNIILRLFDGHFRLRVEVGVEVAYSTHRQLRIEFTNPFRRSPSNRNGDKEGLIYLSALSGQLVQEQEAAMVQAEWAYTLEQFPLVDVGWDGPGRYVDGPFSTWKLNPGEPEPDGVDESAGITPFSDGYGELSSTTGASFSAYEELWSTPGILTGASTDSPEGAANGVGGGSHLLQNLITSLTNHISFGGPAETSSPPESSSRPKAVPKAENGNAV